ncbi:ATP-binding protein [Staphylococcus hyicus]|uniref:ATP-binding protein n=1 Tax=Staphylococcus hyicus TaxID=1284 RepID=UPI0027386D10|nr:ATP-binding protein [Staphylococcus hyicus]MDP4469173.1 ATP-binding protein [Staphylococcus hyicus]
MYKSILFNLESYISIYNTDNKEMLSSFLKMTDDKYRREHKIEHDNEKEDLFILAKLLSDKLNMNQKSGYFLGFKLESKIDQEFDLLRFSEESILNIEMKSRLPKRGLSQIEEQLRRHKFILSIIGKRVLSYTFIRDKEKFYKIDGNNEFIETTIDDLAQNIHDDYIRCNEIIDIDVNKFIISPYSDSDEFLEHKYYLSQDQNDKKKEIKNCVEKKIFIKGHAGTGKSLLLFDLARDFYEDGKQVLLLFCGQLSNDYELTKKYGFKISQISTYRHSLESDSIWDDEIKNADVIFIDEVQRIYPEQYKKIMEKFPDKRIYFAYDFKQVLAPEEKGRFKKLLKEYNNGTDNRFIELKQKIRTNNEMIAFIDRVIDLTAKGHINYHYKNIDVSHFSDKYSASEFIETLVENNYMCIELTQYVTKSSSITKRKRNFYSSNDVHNILGKEYDKVAVIIDSYFKYDENGKLISNYIGYYPYLETEGIYQALTRVKKYLHVIIIDNPMVYENIQQIMTRRFDESENS